MIKRWSRKLSTNVIYNPTNQKGNAEKEREIKSISFIEYNEKKKFMSMTTKQQHSPSAWFEPSRNSDQYGNPCGKKKPNLNVLCASREKRDVNVSIT